MVCDIGLPGLGGYEVARELRRHPTTATAHIVVVSQRAIRNPSMTANRRVDPAGAGLPFFGVRPPGYNTPFTGTTRV